MTRRAAVSIDDEPVSPDHPNHARERREEFLRNRRPQDGEPKPPTTPAGGEQLPDDPPRPGSEKRQTLFSATGERR